MTSTTESMTFAKRLKQNRDWLPGILQKAGNHEPGEGACPGFVRTFQSFKPLTGGKS